MSFAEPARVYALSGVGSSSGSRDEASLNGSSLPDWLSRHGRSNKRQKRRPQSKSSASVNAQLDKIELIQDYEFPEASNKIKSTRDGTHLVATGTYKPHIRVWELDQLSLKFERHTNSENIDFVLLSDDWTKQLHLQTDRTLELHAQGGHHHRVRIPKFGRALAYHYQSAEAIVGAAGSEVYRLNLDHGRFMAPYQLGQGSTHGAVTGCNAVDVNPAHGLLSFGTEGAGVVELWDQRARSRAGTLSIATPTVMDASLSAARRGLPGLILPGEDPNTVAVQNAMQGLSVSALSSCQDGLNMAVGTSTGHVLLYDLRMDKPYTTKDQGFSLPIKSLSWPGDVPSGSRGAHASADARDTVLSADAKGIKVWPKNDPTSNLVSISPQNGVDLNDVHQLPGSGLVFGAVEGTQCAAWYVPTLGPAPKWCSFLDRITDEMEGDATQGGGVGGSKRGVYEHFKFLDRTELESLGMGHMLESGSSELRPYMHGYFVPVPVYEKARLIANPESYAEAREKAIKAKLDKKAESRIRTTGSKKQLEAMAAGKSITVNKDLAERAARQQQQREREERRREGAEEGDVLDDGEDAPRGEKRKKSTTSGDLLSDSRFSELFTNPEFQVDKTSREYALLNPSSSSAAAASTAGPRKKTAVEDEEDEESDAESLDPDQEEQQQRDDSDGGADDDSDDGDLGQFDPRNHAPGTRRRDLEKAAAVRSRRGGGARLVDGDGAGSDDDDDVGGRRRSTAAAQTFEGRLRQTRDERRSSGGRGRHNRDDSDDEGGGADGHSITWTPSAAAAESAGVPSSRKQKGGTASGREQFGAGLSKGSDAMDVSTWDEETRGGRTKRRVVDRSASKNRMRQ